MSALGDIFTGAYAWTEQERIRQLEEDNKFKLYEKQERLRNALADEDRRTQVAKEVVMPSLKKVYLYNADGVKVGERDMDEMDVKASNLDLAKAETDQAQSALDLFLTEQYGPAQKKATIDYTNAQAEATRKYGDAAGRRGSEEGGALGLTAADGSALDKKITDTIVGLENELASPLSDEERMAFEEILKIAPDRNRGLSLVNSVRAQILQDRKDAQKKLEREQASKPK